MPQRKLHLAVYDIASPSRLKKMLHVVKDYATGGQKSAYECYLTPAELKQLILRVTQELNKAEDRFSCVELKQSKTPRVLGKAVIPTNNGYFYIG